LKLNIEEKGMDPMSIVGAEEGHKSKKKNHISGKKPFNEREETGAAVERKEAYLMGKIVSDQVL